MIFYVNGISLLHTIFRSFKFKTVEETPNRSQRTMVERIKRAIQLYKARGLYVNNIHADNEFECCRAEIRPIKMDITGAEMHLGEVERSICIIKERVRCTTHSLFPKIMITDCVSYNIKCLKNFLQTMGC